MLRQLRILLPLVLLFLALTAESSQSCANTNVNHSKPPPPPPPASSAAAVASAPATTVSSQSTVPFQARIGDLLLTVNALGESYTDRIFPAEAGTHYVVVDLTAQNMGSKTYNLNRLNFHLKDSDGFANDPATTDGPKPVLTYNDLVPGQSVRAYLPFKVGDGRTPTELQYQSITGTPGVIKLR